MTQTTVKPKIKNKWLISLLCILIAAALTTAVIVTVRITALSRALSNLDIEDVDTVVKVMKYGGKKQSVVLDVAQKYLDADMPADSARLCIYAIQYLGADCYDLLQKSLTLSGADMRYISAFENTEFEPADFESVTQYGTDAYGASDGVYAQFLGGYCKAKLSTILPIELYAYADGVFVLDSADRLVKSISRDGARVQIEIDLPVDEFLYYESQLYYIDDDGIPHASEKIELQEGERAQNLRIEGEKVVCTVFDKDLEALRDLVM